MGNLDNHRRDEFCNILKELAKDQTTLSSSEERTRYFKRFEELYHLDNGDYFRHFYSDIFSVLNEIQNDASIGDIDILGQNIAIIANTYCATNNDSSSACIDISNSLLKLYDHISLDIARIHYSDSGDDKITKNATIQDLSQQIKELQNNIKPLSEEIEKLKTEVEFSQKNINPLVEDTKKIKTEIKSSQKIITPLIEKTNELKAEVESYQKDYITILGIFASIVLAFVGSLTFSTSVLQNINNVSVYRLIITISLVGIVFSTIIFFLFHYIAVITNKYKSQKLEFAKSLAPLGIAYFFFTVVIVFTLLFWYHGSVESRNDRISSNRYFEETALSEESTTLISIE